MTYLNAVKYLSSLRNDIDALNDPSSLERMRFACDGFGNPEKLIKCIHVCGDVGKDSCSSMLSSILSRSSYKVGRYSIPHHNDFKACISSSEKDISYADFTEIIKSIYYFYRSNFKDIIPHLYEVMTVAALLYFKKTNCDIVILEKGVTRYDPVNITEAPVLSLITPFIERSADISFEDIIHKGTTETVSCPQHKEIYNSISNACSISGCRLTIPIYSETEIEKITLFKTFFKYRNEKYSVRSFSPCQTINAITAIEAAHSLNRVGATINDDSISKGIASAHLSGKCETISLTPTIILSSTCEKDRLDTLLASLAQVKEHLPESINIYLDEHANINIDDFSSSLSTCNIAYNKISSVSEAKDLSVIIKENLSASQNSATLFIGKHDFIFKSKDLIAKFLGV